MSTPRNIRELLQAANDAVAAHDWEALDVTGAVLSSAAKVLRRMELEETHNRWSDAPPFTMEWAAKIVYAGIRRNARKQ